MISKQLAERISSEWIEAWNNHDIESILGHYTDDVELFSPLVVEALGTVSGRIIGKNNLKSYFLKGLELYTDLKFELLSIFLGVDSIILFYKGVKERLVAEYMMLNPHGKIIKVVAHYTE